MRKLIIKAFRPAIGLLLSGVVVWGLWRQRFGVAVMGYAGMILFVLLFPAPRKPRPEKPPNLKAEKILAWVVSGMAVVPLLIGWWPLTIPLALCAVMCWDMWLYHTRKQEYKGGQGI